MPIVTLPLPSQLTNGTAADATQVMLDLNAIANNVNSNAAPIASGIQTGVLLDYAGTVAPSGYLLCDGSAVSRITYSALFIAIGVIWGNGDGSTTFNVPDLRGRATIGTGAGSGLTARTLGTQNIGEETHALSVAELAAHNHGFTDPGHNHGVNDPGHGHGVSDPGHVHNMHVDSSSGSFASGAVVSGASQFGVSGSPPAISSATGVSVSAAGSNISNQAASTGITVSSNGSGTAHNTMQPSAVVQKIIKT